MRTTVATVWGWGDEFENVKENSNKYVSRRWREGTKECSIEIMARERIEGICYYITTYTSNPKNVGNLAERIFYVALSEGDTKVDRITIQLFDTIFSDNEEYRDSIKEVKKELKAREKIIASKFVNDPKVKSVAHGRVVVFIPQINLLCELESQVANKIVMEIIHEDFPCMISLLNSLIHSLVKEGLARRVLGYKLGRSVDDLEVGDVDVWENEVRVWLI